MTFLFRAPCIWRVTLGFVVLLPRYLHVYSLPHLLSQQHLSVDNALCFPVFCHREELVRFQGASRFCYDCCDALGPGASDRPHFAIFDCFLCISALYGLQDVLLPLFQCLSRFLAPHSPHSARLGVHSLATRLQLVSARVALPNFSGFDSRCRIRLRPGGRSFVHFL